MVRCLQLILKDGNNGGIAGAASAGIVGIIEGMVEIDLLGGGKWDNPTMIVTLDSKRRLTVPASLAAVSPGEYFDARFDVEEDVIVFRRLPKQGEEQWLTGARVRKGR